MTNLRRISIANMSTDNLAAKSDDSMGWKDIANVICQHNNIPGNSDDELRHPSTRQAYCKKHIQQI